MTEIKIEVARDFTRFPAGRHRGDGRFSGQAFREDHLLGPLADGNTVVVSLDGVMGYGSSFLEEAFGGLVREHALSPADLDKRLVLETNDPWLRDEIRGYIHEAAKDNPSKVAVG